MKVLFNLLVVALLSLTALQAQTSDESYFLGKWEVLVKETPNGNVTLPARFENKDGKLLGFFTDLESKQEKKMDTVFMNGAQIQFAFNTAGYDLTAYLTKKDDDNATGSLMDMFSMEAKRVKDAVVAGPASYFEGKWDALVKETPNGDATVPVRFEKKDGNWKGYFTEPGSTTEKDMASVKLDGENLVFEFSIAGYDVSVTLTKKDDNTATGRLMSMFDVIATRKK
jgi:hypothetical protein